MVELIVLRAEFFAMKNVIKTCCGLRYKLKMMGVTLGGPTFVYGDNMYVILNTQLPEYILKKSSNSICYHEISESDAMGESINGHLPSIDNVNPSGKTGTQIPQLPLGDNSSPWGYNTVCT
jgi:hypothetical protein